MKNRGNLKHGQSQGFTQHHFSFRSKKKLSLLSENRKLGSSSAILKSKSGAGFTLIELIIYVALAAIVLRVIANINVNLQTYLSRSRTYSNVQRDFTGAINRLKQEIHAANAITVGSSTFGTNPGKLTLVMKDAPLNPTIIDTVVSGAGRQLTIKQGSGPVYSLLSNQVSVDTLIFFNRSSTTQATRSVQFVLGLKYKNPDNLPNANYTMLATTSVELMDVP